MRDRRPPQSNRPGGRNTGDRRTIDAPAHAPILVRLLGTPELARSGLAAPQLSRKAWTLLAVLAIEPRPRTRESLCALLWPDSVDATARSALRNLLVELRGTLGGAVAADRNTVALERAPLEIDLWALDRALEASSRRDDLEVVAARAPGELLAGLGVSGSPELDDWLARERGVARRKVADLWSRLAEARAIAGDPRGAVEAAEAMVASDPLSEPAHRLLMKACFERGDREAAVRAYERCRELLQRELGCRPDGDTEALAKRVLAAEPARRHASLPAPAPLPVPPTGLIGREAQLAEVLRLLRAGGARLLTLTGPGGVGKTRFALELAHRLRAAGVDARLISLADLHDEALVLPEIARALGLAEDAARGAADHLSAALVDARVTLVLDNFEQVAGAAADLAALLERAATLTVVVTSRTVLRVRGEHVFALGPLSYADASAPAVELFTARVGAVRTEAVSSGERPFVIRICERLDGLPLALELAAARARALSLAAVLEQLDGKLSFLVQGPRDLPTRQQTLRATLTWSYELLSQPERQAFRALGVLASSFSRVAFAAATGTPAALDLLTALVDHSLVLPTPSADQYRVLEIVRELALELLENAGERAATERRHTAFVLAAVERDARRVTGGEQSAALEALAGLHDAVRVGVAAAYASPDPGDRLCGLRIAYHLALYFHLRGHWTEGRNWLSQGLEAAADAPASDRGAALYGLGLLATAQEDFEVARDALEQSLSLLSPGVDDARRAWALGFRAIVQIYARRTEGTRSWLQESLSLCRRLGDRFGEGLAQLRFGIVALLDGDPASSVGLCRAAEETFGAIPNAWGMALARHNLAEALLAEGDAVGARAAFIDGFARLNEIGSDWYRALGAIGLAGAVAGCGEPAVAARLLAAARKCLDLTGAAIPALDRHTYERNLGVVREALGPDAFAAAWTAGYSSPVGEVLADVDPRTLSRGPGHHLR